MIHTPVLLNETMSFISPEPAGVYLDATLGEGGHTAAICKMLTGGGLVIGLDRDDEALASARCNLHSYQGRFRLIKGCYGDIKIVLPEYGLEDMFFDGILMDIGVSGRQLDLPYRGFSYRHDAPLDMRMDRSGSGITAEEVVNSFSREELIRIFREYGEERWSKRIAALITARRNQRRITTTAQLVDIIKAAVPAAGSEKKHPARRCFQALRIYVNGELEQLRSALPQMTALLKKGGRLCVISYHSLEDRMVKSFIKDKTGQCNCPPGFPVCRCAAEEQTLKAVTRKPVFPSPEEIADNPRARSARLRVAEKV